MTSIKDFLYEIADEMRRPRDSMNSILKIFEENWYDSVDSIKNLDDEALAKLKLPLRVIELIRKKLSQPTEKKSEEPKKTEPKKEDKKSMIIEEKVDFGAILKNLKKETLSSLKYLESLQILDKVTVNVVKDPKNEQFRTLKLTNEKLREKLFVFPSACEFLMKINFVAKNDQIIFMDDKAIDITLLKLANEAIQFEIKTTNPNEFDPFSTSFSSQSEYLDVIKTQEGSSYQYVEKLDELKKQRDALIKPYIEKKEIKLFSLKTDESIQKFVTKRETIAEEEEELNDDEALYKRQALVLAKQLEESQKFSSKRKKEFEQLVKQPLFTECRIRIKFPNNTLMEAKFSPKENVKNIIDTVKAILVDPDWEFYLYQSPPVYVYNSQNWFKTLEVAEMVPNALLYFSLTDKTLESKVKEFVKLKIES